jgi:hypothetical protein
MGKIKKRIYPHIKSWAYMSCAQLRWLSIIGPSIVQMGKIKTRIYPPGYSVLRQPINQF